MSHFHVDTIELHLYTLECIYGPVLAKTMKILVEHAPECSKAIYDGLKHDFPSIKDLKEQLKYAMSILYQIGLLSHSNNDENGFYYSLNYDVLECKLLIPGIIYNIDSITNSVDMKKLITILLNYGELSELQIHSFSSLSANDFFYCKKLLESQKLVTITSYYHNLLNKSINFYKINIQELVKRYSIAEVRKYFSKTMNEITFAILDVILESTTLSLPLTEIPRIINKKLEKNLSEDEILSEVICLQRHYEIIFGDFKTIPENSRDNMIYSHKNALQFIIDDMLVASLVEECGKKIGRVMSYMLKKDSYVEEYIVSEDCCLPYKETKSILVYLWKKEFIEKEEVTKKRDPMNEQVLYVFYANRKMAYSVFEERIKHALLKCYKFLDSTTDANKTKVLNSCIIDFLSNLMIITAWKNENESVFRRSDRRMSQ